MELASLRHPAKGQFPTDRALGRKNYEGHRIWSITGPGAWPGALGVAGSIVLVGQGVDSVEVLAPQRVLMMADGTLDLWERGSPGSRRAGLNGAAAGRPPLCSGLASEGKDLRR